MKNTGKGIRKEAVRAAKQKPIRKMVQLDGFTGMDPDCQDDILPTDKDGDSLCAGARYELRRTDCIRLQIPSHQSTENVIRILEKMITWLKKDPALYERTLAYLDIPEYETPGGGWIVTPPKLKPWKPTEPPTPPEEEEMDWDALLGGL